MLIAMPSLVSARVRSATYNITVTNTLGTGEYLAPLIVFPSRYANNVFGGRQPVSPEARTQILTGNPGPLAARIGSTAQVFHGDDGGDQVFLVDGESVSTIYTVSQKAIHVMAMVVPTAVPDNFVFGSNLVRINPSGAPLTFTLDRYDLGSEESEDGLVYHVSGSAALVEFSLVN
jgi:hypothetical protein